MKVTRINGRWSLLLPDHRAERPEWPHWEATRLAHMYRHIGGGSHTVYDVGAEEGDLSALWSLWGNDVVLFEPNPRVWPNIATIWRANELRRPLGCFAGFAADSDGYEGGVTLKKWPDCATGPVIGDHGFCNLSERPDIPRIKIDTMAGIIGPPSAITIDVEGAELHVLRGAQATLERARPLVWVSVHPAFMADMYGHTPEMLHGFMAEAGYEPIHLCTDHEEHWFWRPVELAAT